MTFVPGVTPGKWARVWNERMRREPLSLVPLESDAALASVRDGSAHMGLLRDVAATDDLHVIPLYREQPVVVAARDSVVAAFDSLTLADLEGIDGAGGSGCRGRRAGRDRRRRGADARFRGPGALAPRRRRPAILDAPDSGIGLAWLASASHPRIDTFVGIVRGRTENSSR